MDNKELQVIVKAKDLAEHTNTKKVYSLGKRTRALEIAKI